VVCRLPYEQLHLALKEFSRPKLSDPNLGEQMLTNLGMMTFAGA